MIRARSISVIITTYNSPGYLRRVLEAYRYQTRLPDEIIIADDGSTPETAEVIQQLKSTAPFSIRHVWQENQGFRAAKIRNEAVKASQGEYIIFTDGDCIPHHCFVADHVELANDSCFVQGKRMLVSDQASATFRTDSFIRLITLCFRGELRGCHHLLRIRGVVSQPTGLRGIKTCNLGLSRNAILSVNGFNETFVGWGREDAEFAARLYASGLKRKDPLFSALVFHLWHPENSRIALQENDRMLENTLQSGSAWCTNGIIKS